MSQLIECVPNFSEGRNFYVIRQIADSIESVEGIKLLNIDLGKATNRTVITFVGEPKAVIEAAFRGIRKAAELIDMSKQKGEHPRFGSTDVCPLIPIANINMDETIKYAHQLSKRVGEELNISVYCYENAAKTEIRRSLANCRSGEYEGLPQKFKHPDWKPDYGPDRLNIKAGATAIGARNFLIAYNVNLNTTSTQLANDIAAEIRESGKLLREGDPETGKIVLDKKGKPTRVPGKLKNVRAIGWYIDEYKMAQVSMNLTDISITPIHIAFESVCESAERRNLHILGSELIGLIPLQSMLDAGRYFLQKTNKSINIDEFELIQVAIKTMGLDHLGAFIPQERILEYAIRNKV